MTYPEKSPRTEFHQGDEVVLAKGSYVGTPGIFLELRRDPCWANVRERNGNIRSHPVVWLKHSPSNLPQELR